MKNLEILGVVELSVNENAEINGGFVFGFEWGIFWKGVTVGAGIGAAGAAAYICC